jgi:dihydrofolate reductase
MRKLILKMSMSLDGFVGGPNGEVDWIFPSMDAGATLWTLESVWLAGLHVMGSASFHDMAGFWPYSSEPFAAPMNAIPKLVFTKKGLAAAELTQAFENASAARKEQARKLSHGEVQANLETWENPIVATDLVGEIARRKQEGGRDLVAHGGASFARSLVELGLVDEYRLLSHPVVLGRGLPLFSVLSERRALKLLSSTTFPSGAVARIFQPG